MKEGEALRPLADRRKNIRWPYDIKLGIPRANPVEELIENRKLLR
jgi:hypothetical protein